MEITAARKLMILIQEYATVTEEATLKDAVDALENSIKQLDRKQYEHPHRAVLVLDKKNAVVGKISQLDILKALEPKYKGIADMTGRLALSGFSAQFLESMMNSHNLWVHPLMDICSRAAKVRVQDFMRFPSEGEFVDGNASLEKAMHMMVMGQHHSLLVTKNKDIIGILRLTDVFSYISDLVKRCTI